MSLILNIDTATEMATISISEKDKVIDFITNANQKDHASFLHPAIKNLLEKTSMTINKLNAIAVTAGPGSYTGLRVGMATAKGLCYALNIPMITINTLEVIALSAIKQVKDQSALYCPMIDARRMEVFTAIYDYHLCEKVKPCAMILDEGSFKDMLQTKRIYFSGSGILKLKDILPDPNAFFVTMGNTNAVAELAYENYGRKDFANIFYASPVYIKEFHALLKPGA